MTFQSNRHTGYLKTPSDIFLMMQSSLILHMQGQNKIIKESTLYIIVAISATKTGIPFML